MSLLYLTNYPVLVTGAAGFIGSNLVRKLLDLGTETHVILRPNSNQWRIKEISSKLHIHFADITNGPVISKIISEINPKVIFHCAAYGVCTSQNDISKIFSVNFLGTIKLINAACLNGVKVFVNTGSFFEYGMERVSSIDDTIPDSNSAYAAAKLASTLYCEKVGRTSKCRIITLRLFYIYGPYENEDRLIPYILKSCSSGKQLNLTEGKQRRDCVYIDDAVNAYIKATQARCNSGQVIDVGSGIEYSTREIVNKLVSRLNSDIKIKWGEVPVRKFEFLAYRCNISKTEEVLGWSPAVNLDEGLNKTSDWFKVNN